LADGLVARGAGRKRQLEKIAALVDGASFARLLGEVYAPRFGADRLRADRPDHGGRGGHDHLRPLPSSAPRVKTASPRS
jgi:hypothetical protein